MLQSFLFVSFYRLKIEKISKFDRKYLKSNIIEDASAQGGLFTSTSDVFLLINQFKGNISINLLQDGSINVYRGLQIPRHHFLFLPLDSTIKKLLEAGIIQIWIKPFYELKFTREETGPEQLTMVHLTLGFQLWLFFLLVSTFGFISEHLIYLRKYLIFKFIISIFLKLSYH